ncbi:hypothetical protein [Bradyrhizobium sp. WSM1743]|uniref:hypothetical protein n=1 Tax=Bradyrhizobium sp. WSM1743 TaxID=318996 RepID=UPI0012EC1825|nr:hypothetical protein [Bradyrhizobium sp. WSM1743]
MKSKGWSETVSIAAVCSRWKASKRVALRAVAANYSPPYNFIVDLNIHWSQNRQTGILGQDLFSHASRATRYSGS